jgi:hypothetical protein
MEPSSSRGEYQRIRFERQRVQMLVTALDLAEHLPALWDHGQYMSGVPRLLFSSFGRRFPTFPWRLVAQVFWGTTAASPLTSVHVWLRHFDRTYVWRAYAKHLGAEQRSAPDDGRPVGMVFPLAVRGGLIMHNGTPPGGGAKFCGDYEHGGVAGRVWVESYRAWLEGVAKSGWTPDAREIPVAEPPAPHERRRGVWVEPWMIAACHGVGADTMVLAWLCPLLLPDDPGPFGSRFVGRWQGRRCVTATHTQIATALPGLSARQVKEAVATLRRSGLVDTHLTHLWLVPDRVQEVMYECGDGS